MYDRKNPGYSQKIKSICSGCRTEIEDQYVLRVSSGLEWHASCLQCIHCKRILDENDTCFVRNQNIFCKPDYIRLFGSKCDKCDLPFSNENEYVMKLQNENKIFHLDCFACLTCGIRLVPGDKFALRNDEELGTALLCIEHYDLLEKRSDEEDLFTLRNDNVLEENGGSGGSYHHPSFPEEIIKREENEGLYDLDEFVEEDESQGSFEGFLRGERGGGPPFSGFDEPSSSSSSCSSSTTPTTTAYKSSSSSKSSSTNRRIGRVRTVLSEKQLSILKKCYNNNPRPDANIKEQMVEMTGLSHRVVRVWFQNKRCKDKKRQILQKEKETMVKVLGYGGMPPGIPLIASPPVKADNDFSANYGTPIHSYPSGASWRGGHHHHHPQQQQQHHHSLSSGGVDGCLLMPDKMIYRNHHVSSALPGPPPPPGVYNGEDARIRAEEEGALLHSSSDSSYTLTCLEGNGGGTPPAAVSTTTSGGILMSGDGNVGGGSSNLIIGSEA